MQKWEVKSAMKHVKNVENYTTMKNRLRAHKADEDNCKTKKKHEWSSEWNGNNRNKIQIEQRNSNARPYEFNNNTKKSNKTYEQTNDIR